MGVAGNIHNGMSLNGILEVRRILGTKHAMYLEALSMTNEHRPLTGDRNPR